jgi:outer membrane receptor protein involved in Fe transport
VWLVAVAGVGSAQVSGGIRGMVYDSDFDAPLSGAEISVAETGQKVTATEEGNYVISGLEPGTYTLVVAKDGYTRKVFADVVVPAGSMTDQDARLAGEFTDMEEFVVQDLDLGGASEEGLLNLRMEAPALMDSVGADLMSQAGAGDAASALKLVSGATVQDGKYAVVRGLPDRYVVSLMNGVRLPSADPDVRAVQLDQFPSAVIESIQVSKTFTPDQQGDASGGAVNIVLKSIPDEPVLKFKVGTEMNSQVRDNEDKYLSYEGGGVSQWGLDDGNRDMPSEESLGTSWDGAVGVSRTDAPVPYNWGLTAGGKQELSDEIKVGGLAAFSYKNSASYKADAIDDDSFAYGVTDDGKLIMGPAYSGDNPGEVTSAGDEFSTSLFDVEQSQETVQWSGLGIVGAEGYGQELQFLYMQTQTTEDTVTLAEDTRGKEVFVVSQNPDYDPLNPGTGDFRSAAPYQRYQTLDYTERNTETYQLRGKHSLPFLPEIGVPGWFVLLPPEGDWTLSESSSSIYTYKTLFATRWQPGYQQVYPWFTIDFDDYYSENPPAASATLGSLQRIWKTVTEESDQVSYNVKLPFEQWSGDKGYFKYGVFRDEVTREYRQDSFSNFSDDNNSYDGLSWDEYWSDYFGTEDHNMYAASVDVDYDGSQVINAWYYMVDLPLASFFKVVGGVRRETTEISTSLSPDEPTGIGRVYVDNGGGGVTELTSENVDEYNVDFEATDDLPSIGFEFKPVDQVTFRASYSETIARQTFKELVPIQQTEYLGADVFMGNQDLQMSDIENYDLRLDVEPFEKSLVSFSWFKKRIENPIEYVQSYLDNVGDIITPENYPYGEMWGYELEIRQDLGAFWRPLEGLSLGGNATKIHSMVELSDSDIDQHNDWLSEYGLEVSPTRDMLNAPEHLYNIFASYDVEKTGTTLGLFYTVTGDTLVAGAGQSGGNYVPSVYSLEYETLNFSLSQKIGDHLTLSFNAKNLLDPQIQQVYRSDFLDEDVLKTSYSKGITYSLSLSGEF